VVVAEEDTEMLYCRFEGAQFKFARTMFKRNYIRNYLQITHNSMPH